jgi:hypothetical protein
VDEDVFKRRVLVYGESPTSRRGMSGTLLMTTYFECFASRSSRASRSRACCGMRVFALRAFKPSRCCGVTNAAIGTKLMGFRYGDLPRFLVAMCPLTSFIINL